LDDVCAGLKIQVVGVGQKSLCTKFFHHLRDDGLHGGLGSDGDECRSMDVAVGRSDHTGAAEPSRKLRIDTERRLRHAVYSTNRA
jgi:hypothetical protein